MTMSTSSNAPERLETADLVLIRSRLELARRLCDYHIRNQDFLSQYAPGRPPEFYTPEFQRNLLEREEEEYRQDMSCRYYIAPKEAPETLIGLAAVNQIIRGGFQSAFVGYNLDREFLRRGYMTQALTALVETAFGPLRLHRLEANIMPRNTASLRTAARCGFVPEGISPKYMQINGVWEDHIHMVRRNTALED